MRLNKLTIIKNDNTIRVIDFKDGLNLIVNKKTSEKESGNSVGKSTLSRVIDYLFMSSGSDIYHDFEFGKDIPEMVSLINNNILKFKLDFTSVYGVKASISRLMAIDERNSKYLIDDVEVDKKEYSSFVSSKIFGLVTEKPTLRNVSHKFIRNTNDKMQMTLRFLHGNTKDDAYDLLYLFLFGFDGLPLLKKKSDLNKEIRKQKGYLAAYRNPYRETALSKMVKPIKKEIEEAEESIKNFDFKDSHDESLKRLSEIQVVISSLSLKHASLSMRVNNLNVSISSLKGDVTRIIEDDLINIYKSAGVYVSSELKKSYEDMVMFHNGVIRNKIKFLESELVKRQAEANEINDKINENHVLESSLFKTIKEPETLKSINQLYTKLTVLKESLASVEVNLSRINDTNGLITKLEAERDQLLVDIDTAIKGLEKNIEIFNEYFGDLTKEIYNERYLFDLSFDTEKGRCNFDISCLTPNSNGGKKKGEITAFDLAYIKFVKGVGLKRPTFVIHDSIEDVDINKIRDIFNAAKSISGQYIVSVLSDKFSTDQDMKIIKESSILELSENDKFFKV
ncbi:DUF2326 domain-containing protein [Serratia proteamaculans]|uniref:DUF2326 domain-containing protein n=1 Tax=Serratia proteamaculans TaxID=28151 RepID=UPI0039B068B8